MDNSEWAIVFINRHIDIVSYIFKVITEDSSTFSQDITYHAAKYQRQISTAVKRARYLALIPYSDNH